MAPDATLIDRACRLYSSGANAEDFCLTFADCDPECIWLLWHAAKAAHAIDELHPFTSNRNKFVTRNGIPVVVK